MKSNKRIRRHEETEKPRFGSVYRTTGSRFLYISFYYFNQRLRLPTDREDTPANRAELSEFLNKVGDKIRNRTFKFAKTFYWVDKATKAHFTALEGHDFKPEPEHVLFGEFAREWMAKHIPTFSSVTKQRDYLQSLNSRVLPHFGEMTFGMITATVVSSFIDNLTRCDRTKKDLAGKGEKAKGKSLSVKRIKNIMAPLLKIWLAACNHYNWDLRDPFTGLSMKYAELTDRQCELRERQSVLNFLNKEEEVVNKREVFLLEEWQRVRDHVDPHYHVVLELLLMGMIGSELEGLMKQHVRNDEIQIRCSVTRAKGGKVYLKFKPKNWYRKRELPKTAHLRQLLDQAVERSTSEELISFDNDITLPAREFVLTMKDGSPFNYKSFRKTVWDKALKAAGLPPRIPYAARHTMVQWSLLIGVIKTRLVDLMGHSTKKMVDEVYGTYRQGLVDERERVLDYLGEDFLSLEELKVAFPDRYRVRMAINEPKPETAKAPVLAATFGQSFGQSQGLYADNYLK